MTLDEINLLIAEGDPLMPNGWNEEQELKLREHLEQVRQVCVAEYSSVPSHQARAAKNPEYWKRFSIGRHNL
jgi:hypothetical protein